MKVLFAEIGSFQQDTTKSRGSHDDESSFGGQLDHGHGHCGEDEHDDHMEEEKKSLKARLQAVQEVTALVQVQGDSDRQWKELANLRLKNTVQGDSSRWSKPPFDTKT